CAARGLHRDAAKMSTRLPRLGPAGRVPAMEAQAERRRPDRRLFVLLLMRRLAVYALAASVAVWAVPRLLVGFGVIRPAPDETIAAAERAFNAARTYGATHEMPALAAAARELERARTLAAEGHGRDA